LGEEERDRERDGDGDKDIDRVVDWKRLGVEYKLWNKCIVNKGRVSRFSDRSLKGTLSSSLTAKAVDPRKLQAEINTIYHISHITYHISSRKISREQGVYPIAIQFLNRPVAFICVLQIATGVIVTKYKTSPGLEQ